MNWHRYERRKKEFLAQIERIVLWKEWLKLIQPCYYKGERGNKPYPLEIMLRLYLLQNLYDLSDKATVAEAIDSRAFSDFWTDTEKGDDCGLHHHRRSVFHQKQGKEARS